MGGGVDVLKFGVDQGAAGDRDRYQNLKATLARHRRDVPDERQGRALDTYFERVEPEIGSWSRGG